MCAKLFIIAKTFVISNILSLFNIKENRCPVPVSVAERLERQDIKTTRQLWNVLSLFGAVSCCFRFPQILC